MSNSSVGARREEQERYHFHEMTDLLVYSHEEGVAKPDQRIFALTCKRLGIQPEECGQCLLRRWRPQRGAQPAAWL
jgi:FMN phosphatase YigB (HAD superfamily)